MKAWITHSLRSRIVLPVNLFASAANTSLPLRGPTPSMHNNFESRQELQAMYIGKPIRNVSGPFAGRTIRSQLEEYQKPDLGRKFARRDRRPVDPPPVVRLRMYEVLDEGSPEEREEELHADSIETTGLVAHVDLFAVDPSRSVRHENSTGGEKASSEHASPDRDWEPQPSSEPGGSHHVQAKEENVPDIDKAVVLTTSVFGSSFVHAVKVQDMAGETVILFVFADLSVKIEGHFVYRYRCFNLFSRVSGSDEVPITAELYSGIFVIYSTKEWAAVLMDSRWGVRVNLRETSRGRKNRQGVDDGEDDEGSSGGGDTTVDEEQGVQFYTRNFLAPLTNQSSDTNPVPQVLFGPPASYQREVGEYGQLSYPNRDDLSQIR
ncbi:Velvet factor [Ceratobasidium theobromae]|uniref:Velvet factor n=1 Tax=Ceratobasidium theobromae TaxID=1582974 RepID=A0A5N5QLX0_9AGAM|nr:Velvet factor [Ceratobasidium theobromae]